MDFNKIRNKFYEYIKKQSKNIENHSLQEKIFLERIHYANRILNGLYWLEEGLENPIRIYKYAKIENNDFVRNKIITLREEMLSSQECFSGEILVIDNWTKSIFNRTMKEQEYGRINTSSLVNLRYFVREEFVNPMQLASLAY